MKAQIYRELYGREWPAGEKPRLNIPAHLQRTMLGLGLLHEFAVERGKDSERVVLENAISAIRWMVEQTDLMISCAEAIKSVETDSGVIDLLTLMDRVSAEM